MTLKEQSIMGKLYIRKLTKMQDTIEWEIL